MIHKECLAAIGVSALQNCKGKHVQQEKPLESEYDEHSWQVETLTKPTYCQHCDEFIFGFSNQALKCKSNQSQPSFGLIFRMFICHSQEMFGKLVKALQIVARTITEGFRRGKQRFESSHSISKVETLKKKLKEMENKQTTETKTKIGTNVSRFQTNF